MIVNAGYRGKVGVKAPKFTYTGQYNIRKDGVVELLTSGTIVFLEPKVIDLFMVGGGASGSTASHTLASGLGGGGGGYTRTIRNISVGANSFEVVIGAGGIAPNRSGGASSFGAYTVGGGSYTGVRGGEGGSGGGGGVSSNSDYGSGGSGGSDGNNGEVGYPSSATGGNGQGFTTREFGESSGKLYAGGGGGGHYMSAVVSAGGAGGGGTGGWISGTGSQAAAAGVANTGGGGGGGATVTYTQYIQGASGGSGIVCFRESVELPELAGRWVLNDRLYAPETDFYENVSFYAGTLAAPNALSMQDVETGNGILTGHTTSYIQFYSFTTNSWINYHYPVWTFPAGASVSENFYKWLASNATKQ